MFSGLDLHRFCVSLNLNVLLNRDLTKIFNRVQVLGFLKRFGFRCSRYCGQSAPIRVFRTYRQQQIYRGFPKTNQLNQQHRRW